MADNSLVVLSMSTEITGFSARRLKTPLMSPYCRLSGSDIENEDDQANGTCCVSYWDFLIFDFVFWDEFPDLVFVILIYLYA